MHRGSVAVRTLRTRRSRYTRTRALLWRGFFILSALVFALCGAAWFSFRSTFQLERVVIIGLNLAARTETRRAEAAVASVFATESGRFFSPTHLLLYPRRALISAVASSSPRVATATAARGGRILVVAITERTPFARWCADDGESSCLVIDPTGVAFVPAVHDRPLSEPFIFTGGAPTAGARFLPPAEFARVRDTLTAATRLGLSIVRVSRGEGRDMTFVLSDETGIRFVLSPDAPALFFTLPSTLSAARLAISGGSIVPPLHYVDLRFAEQVVFKRR